MNDKSPLDDQWQSLVDDWQSQPYQKVDIQALLKQSQKRTLGAKLLLLFDIVATLAIIIAFIVGYVGNTMSTPTLIYLAICGFGSVPYTLYTIKIRRQTWQMAETSPDQIIARTLHGLEGAIKYGKLLKYTSVSLIPIVNWYIYEISKGTDKNQLLAHTVANAIAVAMIAASYYFQKKREKERDNFLAKGFKP